MSESDEIFEKWQISAVLDGLKICNSVKAKNSEGSLKKCKQCPYYGKDCIERLHNEAIKSITVMVEENKTNVKSGKDYSTVRKDNVGTLS